MDSIITLMVSDEFHGQAAQKKLKEDMTMSCYSSKTISEQPEAVAMCLLLRTKDKQEVSYCKGFTQLACQEIP